MYDNMKTVTYSFPAKSFASGTTTAKLKVPRSVQMARVLDILVSGTTTFTQVTTPAEINVGDGTDPAKFAGLTVGALAAGTTLGGGDVTNGVRKSDYLAGNYNSGDGLHDLTVTFVAPTGGTPAGVADVLVVVGYDQINP